MPALRKLAALTLEEISAVTDPASGLPFLVRKSRDVPAGLTALEIPGPTGDAGFYVMAESWADRLRERGGDAAVEAHINEMISQFKTPAPAKKSAESSPSAPGSPAAHHSHAQPRALDGSGKFRRGLFRAANPRPRVGGKLFA